MRGFVTDCDCYLSDIVPLHVHVPSEADIFGVHSKLVTGETGMPQPIEQLSWVENYTYEGLVIAIFILFATCCTISAAISCNCSVSWRCTPRRKKFMPSRNSFSNGSSTSLPYWESC
ncbi:MAG: hypothetical protein ACLR8Y_11225 [Alistipes indistinctus]